MCYTIIGCLKSEFSWKVWKQKRTFRTFKLRKGSFMLLLDLVILNASIIWSCLLLKLEIVILQVLELESGKVLILALESVHWFVGRFYSFGFLYNNYFITYNWLKKYSYKKKTKKKQETEMKRKHFFLSRLWKYHGFFWIRVWLHKLFSPVIFWIELQILE